MEDDNGQREPNPKITSTEETECLMSELPQGLVMDILSRLPIKSLLICMCVCKTWLHLISDAYFVKTHLAKSKSSILIVASENEGDYGPSQKYISAAQISGEGYSKPFEVEILRLFPKTNLPIYFSDIVNSYNGLVCLMSMGFLMSKGIYVNIVYIGNPILGEYITIGVDCNDGRVVQKFALGFSSISNQYKVLQVFYPDNMVSECQAEIYVVGTGQWRNIGNALSNIRHLDFDVFLNDSIHWIGDYDANNQRFIYSFDFGREQFCRFTFPINSRLLEEKEIVFYYLGVLEDCLFMASSIVGVGLEIWVMKEYGVEESWTKDFVIGDITLYHYIHIEPLSFLSSGEILILSNFGCVVRYDPKSKSFQDTAITQGMRHIEVISYKPSFVSLQDVAKVEELKVLRLEEPIFVESNIVSKVDWARVWFWLVVVVVVLVVLVFSRKFLARIFLLVMVMIAEFLGLL